MCLRRGYKTNLMSDPTALAADERDFTKALKSHRQNILCVRMNNELDENKVYQEYFRSLSKRHRILFVTGYGYRTTDFKDVKFRWYSDDQHALRTIIDFNGIILLSDQVRYDLVLFEDYERTLKWFIDNGMIYHINVMIRLLQTSSRAIIMHHFLTEQTAALMWELAKRDYTFCDCNVHRRK